MSAPMAICIEYMKPRTKAKLMQCVALAGRQPGLRLDSRGKLTWQQELRPHVSCGFRAMTT